jgi:hypothetical protein
MDSTKNIKNKAYWLNIRLTPDEREIILAKCKETTCRSLSEYVRKILFNRTVTVHYHNGSLDKLMEELILLRKELNFIGNNFNQVVRKINAVQMPGELSLWLPVCKKLQEQLLEKTAVIKDKIGQIGKQWLQDS